MWKILVTANPDYSHVRWDHEWPESVTKKMRKDKQASSSVADKISTITSEHITSISDSSSDDSCEIMHQQEVTEDDCGKTKEKVTEEKHVELSDLLKMSAVQMACVDSMELHRHLRTVDAVTANRMHPNNKRKIIR